jgi:hypothetical protein
MTNAVASRPSLLRHGLLLEYLTVGWNVVDLRDVDHSKQNAPVPGVR